MFINKCFSILLSTIITVNSTVMWSNPIQETPVIEETAPVIEETIDESVEELHEEIFIQNEVPAKDEYGLTAEEIDLIALVTMGEAEGEPEEGKRLVIDVILNRVDSSQFPDTVHGVVYAKNAFECLWNGRTDRCQVREDIRQLVIDELQSRTNSNIHFFRTNHYHNFGTPVLSVGNHYFSTY